jgi:hypothetical protein
MIDWLADVVLRRSQRQRYDEIRARAPLYEGGFRYGDDVRYRLWLINGDMHDLRWRKCLLSVEYDGLHVYPLTREMRLYDHFAQSSLRWFGRPQKYTSGNNDIWLHFERHNQWWLLQIRVSRAAMQRLVRALKAIATPGQVTAYRRRRPYIHHGPVMAQAATQDLHGAWTLQPGTQSLYLLPMALVLLDGPAVQRVLPLEHLQQVEVMRRLDDPLADGIVRFQNLSPPETLAFALPDYTAFGAALGEAAKRTLEQPPVFYGKKKLGDDDEDWDEE